MSIRGVNAIFVNGTFRLRSDAPLLLPEGTEVELTIEVPMATAPTDVLQMATAVYAGLQPEQVAEIERVALDRSDWFSGRHVE